jgi:2-haloacid dehalogenase
MEAYLALDPFPEVPEVLARLQGLPCAILSNGAPRMLDAAVRRAGLVPYFQAVISVDAVRIFKPAPEVYALGPSRLGIPRESLGFVSSNAWDVAGAGAYGLQVVWVNRTGAPVEELGLLPDLVLPDLRGLPAALGR